MAHDHIKTQVAGLGELLAKASREMAEAIRLQEAIGQADRLRRDHNGIGGVFLYLGHDGNNSCRLTDMDAREVGKGESGRSLLEAVQRAEENWRHRQFWDRTSIWANARAAADRFRADAGGESADGLFSTACFQAVAQGLGLTITPQEVEQHLSAQPRFVRLKGGCHWLILPNGYQRHVEAAAESRCPSPAAPETFQITVSPGPFAGQAG